MGELRFATIVEWGVRKQFVFWPHVYLIGVCSQIQKIIMPCEIFAICTIPGSIGVSVFVEEDKALTLTISVLRHLIAHELRALGEVHGIRSIYNYQGEATNTDDLVWPMLPQNCANNPIRFDPVPVPSEVPSFIVELTNRMASVEMTLNSAIQKFKL